MKLKNSMIVSMMVLLLAVPVLYAGQIDESPSPDSGQVPPMMNRGMGPGPHGMGFNRGFDSERAQTLENLRLIKLLELLDLDDDQSSQFILIFSNFRKDSRQLHDDISAKVDELAELLKSDQPSDSEIKALVKQIDQMRLGHVKIAEDFHKKAAEILTPVQMGKMVVFENRFEKELIDTVRGFRGGMNKRPFWQGEN